LALGEASFVATVRVDSHPLSWQGSIWSKKLATEWLHKPALSAQYS